MSKKISDDWLSMQQKMFCNYYVEERGNGTKAYARAYKSKNNDSARKLASRLLKNLPIKKRINEIVKETGLNDVFIDMELMKVIEQDQNLSVKLGGIKEFNKIKGRYDKENIEVEQPLGIVYLPRRLSGVDDDK